MADVTLAAFDEMEPIYDGLARRARATLGVTAWGMQLITLPPRWDGYPTTFTTTASTTPTRRRSTSHSRAEASCWRARSASSCGPG